MPFKDPLESSGFKDPLELSGSTSKPELTADQELEEKIKKYRKQPSQALKDLASLDLPLGIIEQIPAGIQAGLGVVQGLGTSVSNAFEPGAYERGKERFSKTALSQALTPRTQSGQAIAGGVGAVLEGFSEHYDDPENIKNILRAIPFAGEQIAQTPEAVGIAGAGVKTLPEILALIGGVESARALKPRIQQEVAKPSVAENLKKTEPTGFKDPIEAAGDIDFWKQRASQMTEEARAAQRPPEVLWAQHETPFNVDPIVGAPKEMEAIVRANEGVKYNQLPPDAVVPRDAMKNEIGEPMLRVPRGNEWIKDENGMPVRQGLPESTVAPDYINRYMRQDEAARNDLGNAIQEANGPKLGPEQHWGSEPMNTGPMGRQRGALDWESIVNVFPKFNDSYVKHPVFHGTTKSFNTYSSNRLGKIPELLGRGLFFFSKNPEFASEYGGLNGRLSGGNVRQEYLNIQKPTIVDATNLGGKSVAQLVKEARHSGSDGLIVNNWHESYGGDSGAMYIVFNKNQITNAISPNTLKGGFGKSQRGAINIRAFDESFEQAKKITDNIRLVARGTGDGMEIQAIHKDGTPVGSLKLSSENWANPKPTDNLRADWVESKTPGIAREMYKYAAELGNDVVPSKAQTSEGRAMWDRFESSGMAKGKFIPKGQLGGINKEALGILNKGSAVVKSYVNDLQKINMDKIAPEQADDFAKKIPGMGNAADGIIIKPKMDLENALNNSKDLPESFKPSVASGPSFTAEKYSHPIVKHVAGMLTWREKKADFAQNRLVKPIERQLNALTRDEQIGIADVLREELFNKERYTDQQLLDAGVSKKGLEAYQKLREQLDTVYEVQAQQLRAEGREVPSKQEAHLASLRNGPWHVVITGQDGRPWHVATRSKWEANKAVKWLEGNLSGDKLKIEVDYRGDNQMKGVPQDILGGYQDILRLLDEEPNDAALVVKETIRNAQEKAGYEYSRQSDRFKKKHNFRGFEGDMPWLSNKENATRLLDAQISYLNNAYSWTYMQQALSDIKNVMSDQRFLKEQPRAAEYLKDIVNLQTGQGVHALKAAEDWIGKKTGFSGGEVRSMAGKANSFTSMILLGGSPGYILQAPLSALHALSLHLKEGSYSPKALALGLEDSLAALSTDLGNTMGIRGEVPMTELGKAAKKYAEDNGVWNKHMFGDMDRLSKNKAFTRNVQEPLGFTIQFPEKAQRTITFMGFVHGLESTGKFKNMYDLFQRAEELTELAATNFRRHEIPLAVQETGLAGQALFKFKAPTLNYFHQLHMNLRDARTGDKGSKAKAGAALAALLGTTAFLGGMESMPGMQELDSGMEILKGMMSNVAPEAYSKMRDISVKEFIRENFGLAAAKGAVERATGAAMQSRFGTDVIDLENPLGSMPMASTAGNVGKSMTDLMKGNPEQAAWRLLPPVAKGNLEVSSDKFETLGGQRRPSNISDPTVALNRSDKDKTMRRFGLRSSEESLQLENSYRMAQQARRDKTASDSLINSVVNDVITGSEDKLANNIRTWMEINPGQDIRPQIASKIMDASVTPDVKQLMAAKSIRAIERAQKSLEFSKR